MESSLVLRSAVEKSCAAELTEKETSVVHGDSFVKKVERSTLPECFRCGKRNHTPDSYSHLKSRCHRCHKTGHIATKCTVTRLPQRPPVKRGTIRGKIKKQGRIGNLQEVEAVEESVNKPVWPMFTIVDSRRRYKEFIVPVVIEGKNVDMELDTGASVTIIPKNVWYGVLATKPLKETDLKLRRFSGPEIPVVGEAEVRVSHHNQEISLPVFITDNVGPVLIGRDWLSALKLDWALIKQMSMDDRWTALQTKYPSLFDDGLGTMKGVVAHLKLKENAKPQFFKPRPVPFDLKEKIATEVNRLERISMLEKIEFSEGATPIVPVLKPDGSVRICGDYRMTINPVLDVQEYPMQTADDIFAQLNGGEKFSKLDLFSSYQQVLLDEESKQYVTISTHLGLFQYTRLPFGVSSSPVIFQKIMDSLTRGLTGVSGILDDLIVTGANDKEHLRNLEGTLNYLCSMRVKLKCT